MDPLLSFLNRSLCLSASSYILPLTSFLLPLASTFPVFTPLSPTSCQAWIFNATLRENILLGSPMREAWYHQVIEACALTSDLKVNNSLESIAFPAVDISVVSASEQRRHDRDWRARGHLVRWTEAEGEPALTSRYQLLSLLMTFGHTPQGEPC